MENDIGKAIGRRYAAVRIGTLKTYIPVSVIYINLIRVLV
jgi:hypothetical protein